MVSSKLSLFVLLAIFCIASAHPVRDGSKIVKASVKNTKLNTASRLSNVGLLESGKKKRKLNSVVRSARRHHYYKKHNSNNIANAVIREGKETVKVSERMGDKNDEDDKDSDTDTDSETDSGTDTDDDSGSESD